MLVLRCVRIVVCLTVFGAGLTGASADETNYEYDALGRLTRVERTDGSVMEYAYDPAGNRTQRLVKLSDDFDDSTIAPFWTFYNPGGNGSVAEANGLLTISVPDEDHDPDGSSDAFILYQGVSDSDLDLRVKVTSVPSAADSSGHGIYVLDDGTLPTGTYVRFDISGQSGGTYKLYVNTYASGAGTVRVDTTVAGPPQYMRIKRFQNSHDWKVYTSTDGQTWNLAGSFNFQMTVARAGLSAWSLGSAGSYNAQFDSVQFENARFEETIQITGSGPVNLRSLADAAGYDGEHGASITFEVGNGVTIMGAPGGKAIDSGTWPIGTYPIDLTLVVKDGGKVYGGGGGGGDGGLWGTSGSPGGGGGDAVFSQLNMSVSVETGGEIKAGGGGGGGGRSIYIPSQETYNDGGGGGGGFPNGPGGTGGGGSGSPGTTAGGGAGGGWGTNAGGAGGDAAQPGGSVTGATGGAPGYAIRKNGNTVTVTNNGTIVGLQE